uniref:NADH dehydrogenase subunit 6 n=1 Tax=Crangonyx forbesi TaxID=111557 RepID=A0A6C0X568_9CRUS|nr:NADH dehydrogenase subunit 6 [Crangonyx forbesi]
MLLVSLTLSSMASAWFILINHPLILSLAIITQTLALSVVMSLNCATSWFSYLLVMIYVTGMMVIFLYVSSLTPNKNYFTGKMKLLTKMLVLLPLMLVLLSLSTMSLSLTSLSETHTTLISMVTATLFNLPNMSMSVLLINYLLLALIVVVKVAVLSNSPLRLSK